MSENYEEYDVLLSELDKEDREHFEHTTELFHQYKEGVEKMIAVANKVEDEEITVAEGQSRIDEIVEEYEIPKFR